MVTIEKDADVWTVYHDVNLRLRRSVKDVSCRLCRNGQCRQEMMVSKVKSGRHSIFSNWFSVLFTAMPEKAAAATRHKVQPETTF